MTVLIEIEADTFRVVVMVVGGRIDVVAKKPSANLYTRGLIDCYK